MAIKYFKKTDNGAITLPTLKTYNNIEIGAITGPVRNDIQTEYEAQNHSQLINNGHLNPAYFGDTFEFTYVLKTDTEKYKLGMFRKPQVNGIQKRMATMLSDAILVWFYVHKLRGLYVGETRYTSLLNEHATEVEITSGHSAGLLDMYTLNGIDDSLTKTDLEYDMSIIHYYTWEYKGTTLSLEEAFEELFPLCFNSKMEPTIYDRQDEFAAKAEELGFKFYQVGKNGLKTPYGSSSVLYDNEYVLSYTVDAFYRNETFISYPLSNYDTILHRIDKKYPLVYTGWFTKNLSTVPTDIPTTPPTESTTGEN